VFGSVVAVTFQIAFRTEIHANDFFYFLKIIFNISISKRSKKYKPHLILAKKKIQNLAKHKLKHTVKQTLKGMDEKLFMHHKNTVDLLLIFLIIHFSFQSFFLSDTNLSLIVFFRQGRNWKKRNKIKKNVKHRQCAIDFTNNIFRSSIFKNNTIYKI